VVDCSKQRYDRRVAPVQLQSGDYAWHYCLRRKQGRNQKWRKLCSVCFVEARVTDVNYRIRLTPNARPVAVHIGRLQRFEGDLPLDWKKWNEKRARAAPCDPPASPSQHRRRSTGCSRTPPVPPWLPPPTTPTESSPVCPRTPPLEPRWFPLPPYTPTVDQPRERQSVHVRLCLNRLHTRRPARQPRQLLLLHQPRPGRQDVKARVTSLPAQAVAASAVHCAYAGRQRAKVLLLRLVVLLHTGAFVLAFVLTILTLILLFLRILLLARIIAS